MVVSIEFWIWENLWTTCANTLIWVIMRDEEKVKDSYKSGKQSLTVTSELWHKSCDPRSLKILMTAFANYYWA